MAIVTHLCHAAPPVPDRRGCLLPGGHPGDCSIAEDRESRARAIRAVVAAQWGVACALFCVWPWRESGTPDFIDKNTDGASGACASLPCAVDLVDGGEA